MSAVLIRNPSEDTEVVDPVKNDGSRFRYEMIFEDQNSRAYADTARELVSVFIPGYEALSSEEERITARVRYMTDLLAPVQANVLQFHDQAAISEADKAVLLQPRFEAVTIEEWSSEVPLVLLDVHYAPWSDLPKPFSTIDETTDPSNIIWLRAADELEMLLSLNTIGLVDLGENTDYRV